MHLPMLELKVLPKNISTIIDSCDGVITEIDMSFVNQMKGATLTLRQDKKSLKEILPKALYERSEIYLKTINPALTLQPFTEMKVWALSATLALLKDAMQNMGLKVIDEQIFTYGKEHNKSTKGIETIEEQMGYFDQFSMAEQLLMLESTLDYLESHQNYSKEMKSFYLSGDEKKMMAFVMEQFEEKKYEKLENKFMEILLYHRNEIMAKRIDILLKNNPKKSYFFAFGTMHFLDKKSVIENLKEKGYKIYRVE
jgi:uncharacterized protein YbaP (TraB family)